MILREASDALECMGYECRALFFLRFGDSDFAVVLVVVVVGFRLVAWPWLVEASRVVSFLDRLDLVVSWLVTMEGMDGSVVVSRTSMVLTELSNEGDLLNDEELSILIVQGTGRGGAVDDGLFCLSADLLPECTRKCRFVRSQEERERQVFMKK